MSLNLLSIFEFYSCKTNGPVTMNKLEKLQEWNLISKNNILKCTEGIFFQLCTTTSAIDGFVWQCGEKTKKKQDVAFFIHPKTYFFFKSHLSLLQIALFSYLWLQNVSLSFIMMKISITEHVVVDY